MYDPYKKIMQPDFGAPPQQGWVQFQEDEPIDMGPAAGAFKQRFMRNGGDTRNVPTPTMDDLPMMDSGMDGGGGAAMKGKGLKSL